MRHKIIFGSFVATWAAIIIFIFFPGYIYSDSFDQYQQAVSGEFSDWHPPIMSAIWRLQILLLGTGSIFYAINMLAVYIALYLLLVPYKCWISFPVFIILALCPIIFGLIPIVWKDVFLSSLVFLSASIAINRITINGKIEAKYKILILVLLLVASLVRANAPFITAPLILLLLIGWDNRFKSVVISSITAIGLIGISGPINNHLLGARQSHPLVSLEVYDLAGISHYSGKLEVPGKYTTEEQQRILYSCYSSTHWDVYAWGECSFVTENLNRAGLSSAWLKAILNNPLAYFKHRLSHFNDFLRFIGSEPAYKYYVGVPPGYQSDNPQRINATHQYYTQLMEQYNSQPWHFGFVWYAISIGLFIASFATSNSIKNLINCLSFASFLYISGYLIVGVAADFRYLLPAVYLLIASIIVLVGYERNIIFSKQGIVGMAITLAIIGTGVLL